MGEETTDSDSSSSVSDILDPKNDEGWEDVEPDDDEPVSFKSLFDDREFSTILDMFQYCKASFGFDIWEIHRKLKLDFLETIKLINYLRTEAKSGYENPVVISSATQFEDEKYLKPVLLDDAVLYSLDDVFEEGVNDPAKTEVEELRDQLAELQSQFSAYRQDVEKVLGTQFDKLDDATSKESTTDTATPNGVVDSGPKLVKDKTPELFDADYFSSYSYNSIHELMLKDAIRTDAYRNFIYDNKHLFKDKVVLDVGCGTGILSMFCAKAGAKLVLAVDNSEIINKARQNVFENGFQDRVKCLRGKIEEVVLPVEQVDIIVSEWMGYCLLYESMLDSVIYARDKYLAPSTGLMVPSHARILAAPIADSELVASHIDFWKDVYGFQMRSMLEKAYDETLIRDVCASDLAAPPSVFLELDLHTATVADLSFSKPFEFKWPINPPTTSITTEDSSSSSDKATENASDIATSKAEAEPGSPIQGLVIWFDIFFLQSRQDVLPHDLTVSLALKRDMTAFSTGPASARTHWQQGVLLLDRPSGDNDGHHHQYVPQPGETVTGTIRYEKKPGQERSLDIGVEWDGRAGARIARQMWGLN